VVVVTRDADEESPAAIAARAPKGISVVMSSRSWDDYRVPASPYFVLVGDDGRVRGEGTAVNWAGLRCLVRRAGGDGAGRADGAGCVDCVVPAVRLPVALGGALHRGLDLSAVTTLVVAVAACGLALAVEVGALPLPTLRRQVAKEWMEEYRGVVYCAGFGLQL